MSVIIKFENIISIIFSFLTVQIRLDPLFSATAFCWRYSWIATWWRAVRLYSVVEAAVWAASCS